MKILELRCKNLNSLYGEWVIDFTDPEYVANGIFALTGPTGAGKSTILDAICLALYGATPRLGKITKAGNEIMSRQTGECYAEVLFESQAGRFRCHWEQRRARKRAEGKLQDQEHQIADADTGRLIETKKSLVGKVIEEKTGMDFDRFTRSILLAQGAFDTFLKADDEQKSRILEQISGTGIYSEISRRVHERQRDERDKLNLLQAETSGIAILAPEQETQMQQELEEKQKQEEGIVAASAETSRKMAWLTSIAELEKEIDALKEDEAELQRKIDAFRPERSLLDMAVKAASLDGIYATLTAFRTDQAGDRAALNNEEAELAGMETAAITAATSLEAAEMLTRTKKEELTTAAPLLQNIRALDQNNAGLAEAIEERSEACARDEAAIEKMKVARAKELEKRTEAEYLMAAAESYLQMNAGDEWLIGGLAGIEEQFANLLAIQGDIVKKEADLKTADTAVTTASQRLETASRHCFLKKQELEEARTNLQQGRNALSELLEGRLLREYRTEKDALLREMAYIRKIEELEDYRSRLEDGRPCPLCGSTQHPFAKGSVPGPDEIELKIESMTRLIARAEEQETAIMQLEDAERVARDTLNDSEKLEIDAINNKKAAETTLEALMETLTKLRSSFDELKLAITHKLEPLGYTIDFADPESAIRILKSNIETWQEQARAKSELEKQIAAIDSEMKRLDALMAAQARALGEKQENLERLKKEHATGTGERKALYGDKCPDDEERRLHTAVSDAEEAEKNARNLNTALQQKLTTAKTHVASLVRRIGQREPELKRAETDFAAALVAAGFADEAVFLGARLTTEEREALSSRAKELDDAQTELKARQKDRQTRLSTEVSRKLTGKTHLELEAQLEEYEDSLKVLRDAIAGLKHQLSENRAAKERVKEKQSAIVAQQKECQRWDKLHVLIGSSDGKKYRTFAQGLTFELMVSHANRQLEKMTDRYLLVRDEQIPLELNVVDTYQAGEIRSTRNLSGGESFIVSLSLALGLSKMASRKVRVDSLFLDEGFGTLDEDALETALEALSGLQQDGKLIGVISHVSALKERIGTQIDVIPVSGGRSSLSGPGCRNIRSEKARQMEL
ncbi:AAA family ATPase [Prosthecochloris sp. HL-130-GSB]|uniref:AAA family ATPase n=1 Tax=Prosthecochloris sp. HL-130-GSB TaxID=1974213 RepID=UPI000A1C05ED|nr:AAA family ATPase [Prosthecochloris sp. HL-130-GSB]ARM31155.1 chromosome segregation protein SMC [Prosthecochloris sp. HL-130-GSB]